MRAPIARSAAVATLLLVTVLAAGTAHAQDVSSEALRAGSWALTFQVTDNFQLSSFDGAILSVKHHTSDRAAWRLGVGFNGALGLDRDEFRQTIVDTLFNTSTTVHQDLGNHSVHLDLLRVKYPEVDGRVHPFWALGPHVIYGNSSDTRIESLSDGSRDVIEQSRTSWFAGLQVKLGVEVFATRAISLLGEYGMAFSYVSDKIESTRRSESVGSGTTGSVQQDVTTNGFQFGDQSVRLGVAAYF